MGVDVGTDVTPAELAEFEKLRNALNPADSLARATEYAKWVFGGTVAVGALAAGASGAGASVHDQRAAWVYGVALVLLGIAMAASSWALAPAWRKVYVNSDDSLREHIELVLQHKRRWLPIASSTFGFSLLVAGSVSLFRADGPLHTGAFTRTLRVSYSLSDSGILVARAVGTGLPSGVPVTLFLASVDSSNLGPIAKAGRPSIRAKRDTVSGPMIVPREMGLADVGGNVSLTLRYRLPTRSARVLLRASAEGLSGREASDSVSIPVIRNRKAEETK